MGVQRSHSRLDEPSRPVYSPPVTKDLPETPRLAPNLAAIAFLAPDYESGLAWFRDRLGLAVLEDRPLGGDKRWLVLGDAGGAGARFVVARAEGERQLAAVGAAAGGRVGYFLETEDFAREHKRLSELGVEFLEAPRREPYGTVAVFKDPWGGKWDLIQPARKGKDVPLERQIAFFAIVVATIALVVDTLGSTIAPFAFGIAIGYLLNPVVHRMQKVGFSRLTASLTILLAFVGVVGLAGVTLVPALLKQLAQFSTKLPQFVETLQNLIATKGAEWMQAYGGHWVEQFGLGDYLNADQIKTTVGELVSRSGEWLLTGLKKLAVGGAAAVGFLSFLIVTPVVAFYILVDWHKMVRTVDTWLPRDYVDELRTIAGEIDLALAGFLRGQSLVCLFLGLWYGIGLSLIGLDFSLLIGVAGGVLSFIPYIGSLTALVLSLGVATVQKWPDMHLFLYAFGVVGAGQFLESNVVSPKLVGESIGLHPVWLIFALFAFGEWFGFTGLLVAVPLAAAIGVVVRHLIRSYQRSPLYRGKRVIAPAP
jgi:predicted PurR-regulated permease PerM/predicted enzyme related to lactoylglutathione lyase